MNKLIIPLTLCAVLLLVGCVDEKTVICQNTIISCKQYGVGSEFKPVSKFLRDRNVDSWNTLGEPIGWTKDGDEIFSVRCKFKADEHKNNFIYERWIWIDINVSEWRDWYEAGC